MAFRAPLNPQVLTSLVLTEFAGVGGPSDEMLRLYDSNGNNISGKYANEQEDLDCERLGCITLRPGMYKSSTTGRTGTIRSIYQVRLSGVLQYLIFYGDTVGHVDLEMPFIPEPEMPDSEDIPPTPSPYRPPRKPPDSPPPDITGPPDKQSCEEGVTWTVSPTSLAFTWNRDDALPSPQYGWIQRAGWTKKTSMVTRNHAETWWVNFKQAAYFMRTGQCKTKLLEAWRYEITDDTLDAGTYTSIETLKSNDGLDATVTVTVTVTNGASAITGDIHMGNASYWYQWYNGEWHKDDEPDGTMKFTRMADSDYVGGYMWYLNAWHFFGNHKTSGRIYGREPTKLNDVEITIDGSGNPQITWWAGGGSNYYVAKGRAYEWTSWTAADKAWPPNPAL